MQETWVRFLSQEDPLEEGMATHSSILAWRIPWTEEPGRLQSMQSQKVEHDWVTACMHAHRYYLSWSDRSSLSMEKRCCSTLGIKFWTLVWHEFLQPWMWVGMVKGRCVLECREVMGRAFPLSQVISQEPETQTIQCLGKPGLWVRALVSPSGDHGV